MKLKEQIENVGYRLFLKDDEGIQHEFDHEKKLHPEAGYLKKSTMLMQLIAEKKLFHRTDYEKWFRKQMKLPFPSREDPGVRAFLEKIRDAGGKTVVFDLWNVLAVPFFGSLSETEDLVRILWPGDAQKQDEEFIGILKRSLCNQLLKREIETRMRQNRRTVILCQEPFGTEETQVWLEKNGWEQIPELITGEDEELFSGSEDILHISRETVPDPAAESVLYHSFPAASPVRTSWQTVCDTKIFWSIAGNKKDRSYFYRMGYIYGGILSVGFCMWLEALTADHDIGKVLFCSRDGKIFSRLWEKCFGRENGKYLYISRRALSQAMYSDRPDYYLDHVLVPMMGYGQRSVTIREAFEDLGISFLTEDLGKAGLSEDRRLDYGAYDALKTLFTSGQEKMEEHFSEEREAAFSYLDSIFRSGERILIVDLGWHGTIFRMLEYLNRQRGWNCTMYNALLGTMEEPETAALVSAGKIDVWLFSSERNNLYRKQRGEPYNHNQIQCLESIFSSEEGSVTKYVKDKNGRGVPYLRDANPASGSVREMHRGILDFAEDFYPLIRDLQLRITPQEAFLPMAEFLDNRRQVARFCKNLKNGGRSGEKQK